MFVAWIRVYLLLCDDINRSAQTWREGKKKLRAAELPWWFIYYAVNRDWFGSFRVDVSSKRTDGCAVLRFRTSAATEANQNVTVARSRQQWGRVFLEIAGGEVGERGHCYSARLQAISLSVWDPFLAHPRHCWKCVKSKRWKSNEHKKKKKKLNTRRLTDRFLGRSS